MPRRDASNNLTQPPPREGYSSLDRTILFCLVLLTLALFSPVLRFEFVSHDDPEYVSHNPHVQQGLTGRAIAWAFTSAHGGNWHPLTSLSHILDWQLFGPVAGGHHLVNVLFHAANTVLLFVFLRRTTKRLWPGAFVAALFALHPQHVESVAWVSERKDVLSGFFFFLTLLAYARYAERPSGARYSLVMLWLALGLMSKPMLVTTPCVLLLLDFWPLDRVRRSAGRIDFRSAGRLFVEKLPLFGVVALASVVTLLVQRGSQAVVPLEVIPLDVRLANAVVSYLAYLGQMFWPAGLAVYYPLRGYVPAWQVIVAAGFLIGVTVAAGRWAHHRPYLLVGWLWYVGMLVPVIGIVMVGQAGMADRYTYLPMIGIWVAITWGACEASQSVPRLSRLIAPVAAAVIAACAVATWFQLQHWRDSVALFDRASRVTTFNAYANFLLAGALADRGRNEEALAAYRESVRVMPTHADAHYRLAVLLDDLRRVDEAIVHYREAIRLNPNYGEAHNNLGLLLAAKGKWEEAAAHAGAARRALPHAPGPHFNRGQALAALGRSDEAIAEYREAVRLKPDYLKAHHALARTLVAQGRREEAATHFRAALELATAAGAEELAGTIRAEMQPQG